MVGPVLIHIQTRIPESTKQVSFEFFAAQTIGINPGLGIPRYLYLVGLGDLVNGSVTRISHAILPIIPIMNLLTKYP